MCLQQGQKGEGMGDQARVGMDMQVTVIEESFLLVPPDPSCLEVQILFLPSLSWECEATE